MTMDLPTLMIAGSFVAAVSGVFLVFAWLQNRKASATLWWAASNLVLAISIPMMAASDFRSASPSVIVAITLLNLNPALIWASARACNGRHVNIAIVTAGALFWLIAFSLPIFRASSAAQLTLNLSIVAAFLLAAAYEFWRDRHERLTARWPLIVLLALHGSLSAIAAFESAIGGIAATAPTAMVIWLEFIHFETLAFVIGTSIFTVAMARERSEMLHRIAAATDALTDVATRRAFYDGAEHMIIASQETSTPLTMIVFDLDGFKSINDTYGHAHGDDVLKTFGRIARKTLRGTDLIGRLGGEEFAAVLPGASVGTAFVAAERIRVGFSQACKNFKGQVVNATVSAGIAQANRRSTLDSLLKAADAALYQAKKHGRDRVEVSEQEEPVAPPADVAFDRRVA
jgi:diguanylate cyclase (GGDEF)-like protein